MHDVNSGGFLAHRKPIENEDETENLNTNAVVRAGCERHPQIDMKVADCIGFELPLQRLVAFDIGQFRNTVTVRGKVTIIISI